MARRRSIGRKTTSRARWAAWEARHGGKLKAKGRGGPVSKPKAGTKFSLTPSVTPKAKYPTKGKPKSKRVTRDLAGAKKDWNDAGIHSLADYMKSVGYTHSESIEPKKRKKAKR